jgi:hypothetical protein
MFKKNVFKAALILGGALLSFQASAESYFGGSVGRAKWNIDCVGATGCHTTASSAKFFLGYDFNPNLGIEGTYIYLNEVSARDKNVSAAFSGRGFDIAAVGKMPIVNNFYGFAKAGVSFMKGEVSAIAGGYTGGETHYSSQPLIGLGVIYQIDKKMAIRAELDRRNVKVSGYVNSTSGVTNFSVGIQTEF